MAKRSVLPKVDSTTLDDEMATKIIKTIADQRAKFLETARDLGADQDADALYQMSGKVVSQALNTLKKVSIKDGDN